MFDARSDDSSEASSGDDLLNLVPFSQETTTSSTSPEKRVGIDSTEKIKLGIKRIHDEIDVKIVSDEAKMEERGESLKSSLIKRGHTTYLRFPTHSMLNAPLIGMS